MNWNVLRDALWQQPFEPFTVHLADGRKELVKHPESMAIGPRVVVIVREDNSVLKVEPLMIVSLEQKGQAGKRGDGASRKRRPPA